MVEDEDGSLPGDDTEAQWPRLYSDEDAIALAKLTWGGGARGVPVLEVNGRNVSTRAQQAAVMWTVLNRFDEGYEDSIIGVITAKGQFHGYSESHPIEEDLLELAYDVLDRWNAEKHGETVVRELPATTLADHCYSYMFSDCTGLTQAPALPAITLKSYCYQAMFQNCTSLTNAPALPAITLAYSCYNMMFQSCKKLNSLPSKLESTRKHIVYLCPETARLRTML